MTQRTTLNRLMSYSAKKEAEARGDRWYVNPNRHPLPQLPSLEYLAGPYIIELAKSGVSPDRIEKAVKTISLITRSS